MLLWKLFDNLEVWNVHRRNKLWNVQDAALDVMVLLRHPPPIIFLGRMQEKGSLIFSVNQSYTCFFLCCRLKVIWLVWPVMSSRFLQDLLVKVAFRDEIVAFDELKQNADKTQCECSCRLSLRALLSTSTETLCGRPSFFCLELAANLWAFWVWWLFPPVVEV